MVRPGHERVVLHVDMDAFYAAVEVRENPALAGLPLIVGHKGRRGVVATCSYEARAFGVRSAMPSVTAGRVCPQAIWVPARMDLYARVSAALRRMFDDVTPRVEPVSIDEAFLDLTGFAPGLAAGRAVALDLKERIRVSERLTASIGIAPNKFLAKVASDLEKPDGLVVLASADVPERLWPLPVERLWGVGPRTAPRLRAAGLATIGDLLKAPGARLDQLVGAAWGARLRELARGVDDRRVEPFREAKSISEERTYETDLRTAEEIDRALLERSEGVARELRREGLTGRTIRLKVRTGDFTTWTRVRTLPEPSDLAEVIVRAARALLRERIRIGRRGVRLLGVGVSGLQAAGTGQSGLFPDAILERAGRAARAADLLRDRHGERSVIRARFLPPPGRRRRA